MVILHSIKGLSKILGYTPNQVRLRLNRFNLLLSQYTKRGENNEILLENSGLKILEKAKQLEDQELSLTQVSNHLREELETPEGDGDKVLSQTHLNRIQAERKKELKERIEKLEREKKYFRNKVDELETKLLSGKTSHRLGVLRQIWKQLWG